MKALSLIVLAVLLASCATSSLRYMPTPLSPDFAPGTLVWAGIQCDLTNVNWWIPKENNSSLLFHFQPDGAGFMVDSLKDALGEVPEVVTFSTPEQVGIVANSLIHAHFSPLWTFGPKNGLVMADASPRGLSPLMAEALDKKSPADYFLVLDADFVRFRLPSLFNFSDLRFQVEVALVAYDRKGKRVASEYWTTVFAHQTGDYQDFAVYTGAVQRMIRDHGDEIRKFVTRLKAPIHPS